MGYASPNLIACFEKTCELKEEEKKEEVQRPGLCVITSLKCLLSGC
jgi:hypothetical protein